MTGVIAGIHLIINVVYKFSSFVGFSVFISVLHTRAHTHTHLSGPSSCVQLLIFARSVL